MQINFGGLLEGDNHVPDDLDQLIENKLQTDPKGAGPSKRTQYEVY